MQKIKEFFTKHKNFSKFLVALLINVAIFGFIAIFQDYLFFLNDDKNMQDAISGKYTGTATNYGVFVGQLMCLPLRWLYSLAPTFPFYSVTLFLIIFCCCVFICYYILDLSSKKGRIISIAFYCLMFMILFFDSAVNIQFTKTAIFPVLLALLIIAKNEKLKVYHYFEIAFLFLLAYTVRSSVFLLALIFVAVFLILRLIKNKKLWKSSLLILLCGVFAVGVNMGVDALTVGRDAEFQKYSEYNSLRADICDHYGMPDYSEAPELYDSLDISPEAVGLIKNHYMWELDEITPEKIQAIVEYQKAHNSGAVKESLKSVGNILFTSNVHELLFFLVLAALMIIFSSKKKMVSIVSAVMLVLMIGLSIAISIVMKFPSRVCSCVTQFTIFTLLGTFLSDEYKPFKKSYWVLVGVGILALGTIAFSMFSVMYVNVSRAYFNDERKKLEQVIAADSDHIYFLDNSCASFQTEFIFEKNNRVERTYFSSWHAKSPYQKMLIEGLGYSSVNEMFEKAPNLKIVTRWELSTRDLEAYLSKTYNRTLTLETKLDQLYIYVVS